MQDVIFTSSEAPLSRGAIILLWGAIFSLPRHFDAGVPLFTPGVPYFPPQAPWFKGCHPFTLIRGAFLAPLETSPVQQAFYP